MSQISEGKAAWSVGLSSATAVLLLLVGVFQFFAGLAGIIGDQYFVIAQNYAFSFDTTTWGWIHLILGVVAVLTGVGLMMVQAWAVVLGIIIAFLGAVANFLWLPYQPWWSVIMIVIYAFVIWALANFRRAVDAG